jgi:hypothetical protein
VKPVVRAQAYFTQFASKLRAKKDIVVYVTWTDSPTLLLQHFSLRFEQISVLNFHTTRDDNDMVDCRFFLDRFCCKVNFI